MKTQKNSPIRRQHKRRHHRRVFRLFLPFLLATGCFTVILSMTSYAFYKRTISEERTVYKAILEKSSAEPENLSDHAPEAENTDIPWYLTLVNRQHPLPENYMDIPINLMDLPGGEKVDERIYEPLMELLADADDLGPVVVSGYRTPEKQQDLYNKKIKEYQKQGYSESEAVELALQWVAEPGTSEHQLGLAVDINGATYDIYLWLQENSYKYGFIFRYPGNKSHITNVAEEVWHYRYVGKEAAAEIYERGICLEEYLESLQ